MAGRTGMKMPLQPWQKHVIDRIYARDPATGRRLARRAMVGMARKGGKSGFAAVLALYALMCEGDGAEVYGAAADREQAKLIHIAAKRMIEMDPDLSSVCKLFRDAIEYVPGGSVYRAISSEAYTKEGLSPSAVIADEIHAWPDREMYDVLSLAMGARKDPLMLMVTTAGVRQDRFGHPTIALQLYEMGCRIATGEVMNSDFYMAWWEAHADNPKPDSIRAWEEANPSLGTILDPADMKSALPPVTPEAEYVTKRLNKFVAAATTWLPHGSWDACEDTERVVKPDEPVIVAFDGSWTNDSTALVLVTVENPHVKVLRLWERPIEANTWVVPSQEVEDAVLETCAAYNVREIACDPYYWREQLARWSDLGLPVVEWPSNSLARIVPACKEFYRAVVERRLTHDGDKRLTRHLANATIKEDSRGARIVKRARGAKIDLAVAAIIGHDRAIAHTPANVPIEFLAFD